MNRTVRLILVWTVPLIFGLYAGGGILPPLLLCGEAAAPGPPTGIYAYTCHQEPERSFFADGCQFGFCSRCTGFYPAVFLVTVLAALDSRRRRFGFWLAALLSLPAVLDFLFDVAAAVPQTNMLRLVTGAVAGFAVAAYLYPRYLRALD